MHDWSDNELDGMSREAADNYSPGREVPDWDGLQKRLDKELPLTKENNRKRFLFLIILCLLLSGVTGYLLITKNNGTGNQQNEALSDASRKLKTEHKVGDKNDTNSGDKNKNTVAPPVVKKDDNTDNKSDGASATTVTPETKSALSLSTRPQNSVLNPASSYRKSPSPKNQKKKNGTDQDFAVIVEGAAIGSRAAGSKNQIQKDKPVADTKNSSTETAIAAEPETQDSGKAENNEKEKSNEIAKDTAATVAEVKKAPTIKSTQKSSAIELSILAGVDVSNVKFKYGDDAGINLGLLAGYRFNKRWSVGTGLIYTKKNYTAAGEDFNPPKSYWTNGINLDKVDGSCYMWEIPVNASYHFNTTKKSGWFISMGLSSYFMTKEDYTYYYKYNNGNPTTRYWQNADPSNYWFSILGVSAGWEKNLGRGLSLGVSPYGKIPLKGVGFGNMRLSSYGVNLLLTYRKATGRK